MRRGQGGTALVANEHLVLRLVDEVTARGRSAYGYVLRDRLPMNHGTLYRCLNRLAVRGLLDRSTAPASFGPPRYLYRLTRAGREQLEAA